MNRGKINHILDESKKKKQNRFGSSGWAVVGGARHYFRSNYEKLYAMYLQFLKANEYILHWEYEPRTFWFEKIRRGIRSYKPDFKVIDLNGEHYWVEVKGYLDPKSKTKLKRFQKYYPKESMKLVDSRWFKINKAYLMALQTENEDEC